MVLNIDDWVETKNGNIALVVARRSRRLISLYTPEDHQLHEDVDVDIVKGCFPAVRRLLHKRST
ncbi:hypothetical protein SEA_KEANU_68 [Streptomyces phage Keanu]|nr:hypothetical protein SEA_KEANU_68 [Streptomyces phage Keanu]